MTIDNLPTDRGARFLTPSPFVALNELFGPRAADRAASVAAFLETVDDADDAPGRYAALQSRISAYESDDGGDLARHVADDLIAADPAGWRELNRQIGDALRQVAADPSHSFIVTLELVEEQDDPGESVRVLTHDLGRLRLIRWLVGDHWAGLLGIEIEIDEDGKVSYGSKRTPNPIEDLIRPLALLPEILASLDDTPRRP